MSCRPVLVNEIDRVLAECRAISFALKEGYSDPEVVGTERLAGVWRVDLRLARESRDPQTERR